MPSESLYLEGHCYTNQILHSPTGCLMCPEQWQDYNLLKIFWIQQVAELWLHRVTYKKQLCYDKGNRLLHPWSQPPPAFPIGEVWSLQGWGHPPCCSLQLLRGTRNPILAQQGRNKSSPGYSCLRALTCLLTITQILNESHHLTLSYFILLTALASIGNPGPFHVQLRLPPPHLTPSRRWNVSSLRADDWWASCSTTSSSAHDTAWHIVTAR